LGAVERSLAAPAAAAARSPFLGDLLAHWEATWERADADRPTSPLSSASSALSPCPLRRRPENFIRWVIAHELAHAHLRNAGRHKDEDPEHAADSLAADWGFPRPRP